MIKAKGDLEKVGDGSLRVTVKLTPGGVTQTFDSDGGDTGRGNGGTYDAFVVNAYRMKTSVEQTLKVMDQTRDRDLSTIPAKRELLADMMEVHKHAEDAILHTDGTGVYATANGATTAAAVIMASPFYQRLLHPGMVVDQWDSALTTNRSTAGGSRTISSIDPSTYTVNFAAAFASGVAGDKFLLKGLSSAVFRKGLPYLIATSGTYWTLARASYPQLKAAYVDGGSNVVSPMLLQRLKDGIIVRRGENVFAKKKGWMFYTGLEQRASIQSWLQRTVSMDRRPSELTGAELAYNTDEVYFDGIPIVATLSGNSARIDLFNINSIHKAETVPTKMLTIAGDDVFPIYGASGGPAAAELRGIYDERDYFMDDPGMTAYADSLGLPTGYPV